MSTKWDTISGSQSYKTGGAEDILTIKHLIGQRDANRLTDKFDLAYSYSIVGMDATKVGAAVQSINDYVERVENCVRQINEDANMNMALKSDVIQISARNYVKKVEEYCANLCSQLKLFRDRLQEAEAAWKDHAESLSQGISVDTASFDTGTHKE